MTVRSPVIAIAATMPRATVLATVSVGSRPLKEGYGIWTRGETPRDMGMDEQDERGRIPGDVGDDADALPDLTRAEESPLAVPIDEGEGATGEPQAETGTEP